MNNTCDNCIFSIFATGKDRAVLICQQKKREEGRWKMQLLKQYCQNFYPSTAYRRQVEAQKLTASSKSSDSPPSCQPALLSRRIPLTQGQFALVDIEDYPQLSKFTWYARKSHNTYYAVRKQNGKSTSKKTSTKNKKGCISFH